MRIFMLVLLYLLCATNVYGCMNDFDCGYGNKCVQPEDAINPIQGICVTPTENGVSQPYAPEPSATPHQVEGCQFDTDCDPGYSCLKRNGELSGVCAR